MSGDWWPITRCSAERVEGTTVAGGFDLDRPPNEPVECLADGVADLHGPFGVVRSNLSAVGVSLPSRKHKIRVEGDVPGVPTLPPFLKIRHKFRAETASAIDAGFGSLHRNPSAVPVMAWIGKRILEVEAIK